MVENPIWWKFTSTWHDPKSQMKVELFFYSVAELFLQPYVQFCPVGGATVLEGHAPKLL